MGSAASLDGLLKIADIIWLLLCGISAWGIGTVIVARVDFLSIRGAAALMLGLASLSYLFLILGLLGLMIPALIRGLVLFLALSSLPRLWYCLRTLSPELTHPPALSVILILLLTIKIALSLFAALDTPSPVALSHYHLRIPLIWLQQGKVSWPFTDILYHYPQGMEVLYALGLTVGGVRMPQLIHFLTALATLWGLMAFARRRWGRNAALLTGVFYWSIPEVYYLATMAFVDLAWSGAEILAVLLFVDSLHMSKGKQQLDQWALAGALVGWAAAIKYSALWSTLFLGLGITWVCLTKTERIKKRLVYTLKATLGYTVFVLLIAGFWYSKNWILFGNPVYPFLWGGRGLSSQAAHVWTGLLRMFGPSRSLKRFLQLPWDVFMARKIPSMRPAAFPYPIALLPVLIPLHLWKRTTIVFLIYICCYVTTWYWTGTQQLRFVVTPIALSGLLAAQVAARILCHRQFLTILVTVLIFVSLILGTVLEWQALAPHIMSQKIQTPPELWPRW